MRATHSHRRTAVILTAAGALAAVIGLATGTGVAASRAPSVAVTVSGPGTVRMATTYRGHVHRYTVTSRLTIRVARGTRVALAEYPGRGAGFIGWSGGCRSLRSTCVVTVRSSTAIRASFVRRSATTTAITCANVTYNGHPQAPCSAQVTGLGGFHAIVPVVYPALHTNAGTVPVTASFAGDPRHLPSAASGSFVINKATPSVAISPLPSLGTRGASFTPTVSTTGDGVVSVTSDSPGICTVSNSDVTYDDVGTCSLTAHVAAGANYTAGTGASQGILVKPTPLIVDTDIFSSPDDVGGLATAFGFQLQGQANVIAAVVNTRTSRPVVAANSWKCLAAIAQFYGSTNTLLGTDTAGTGTDTNAPNDYIGTCAGLASPGTSVGGNSAVSVYRQALASQPDHSVQIASIGYFENLAALLKSGPDQFSNLTGAQLVAQKVRTLVAMAGCYPNPSVPQACTQMGSNPENNFVGNIAAAKYVATNWPTKVVWSGYEVGSAFLTGGSLSTNQPTTSPVRASYEAYFQGAQNHQYDSFDQTAVYYAIQPGDTALGLSSAGTNVVDNAGSNSFTTDPAGKQYYLLLNDGSSLQTSLNSLMDMHP